MPTATSTYEQTSDQNRVIEALLESFDRVAVEPVHFATGQVTAYVYRNGRIAGRTSIEQNGDLYGTTVAVLEIAHRLPGGVDSLDPDQREIARKLAR